MVRQTRTTAEPAKKPSWTATNWVPGMYWDWGEFAKKLSLEIKQIALPRGCNN